MHAPQMSRGAPETPAASCALFVVRYLQESAGRRPLCEMFTCKHGGLVYMSDMQDRIIEIINGWHRSGPSTSGGAPALT